MSCFKLFGRLAPICFLMLCLNLNLVGEGFLAVGFDAACAAESLPKNLKWETNETDPVFASEKAKKGGIFRSYLDEFPLTLRIVGPDAQGSFSSQILFGSHLPLLARHPNTNRPMPILAQAWAFGPDRKTMYFKIHPRAKWSDGVDFTAADIEYTLQFMRMKEIQDPVLNEMAEKQFEKVIVFDQKTFAIVSKQARNNLDYWVGNQFSPIVPKHFFEGKVNKDFVKTYNWTVVPGTGPYMVSEVEKGKRIKMTRVKNWWGENERFFKNRFNVDEVDFKLFRDEEVAFEAFKKGAIEHFWLTRPIWWHDKTKDENFSKGYIHKLWFYNQKEDGPYGFFLNTTNPLFQDLNVRHAFAHAMNVDLVTKQLIYGDYVRKDQFFEGYGEASETGIHARPYSIEKVKELMEKSGWKRGPDGVYVNGNERFQTSVTVGKSGQIEKRLEVLRQEALKAGLELMINAIDPAAAFKAAREKKFEVYYGIMEGSTFPEPRQYFHSEFAGPNSNNFSAVKDAALDKLCDDYRDAKSQAEEVKIMQSILKRVHDLGIFVGTWSVPFTREGYWRWVVFPEPTAATKKSDYLTVVPNHYLYGGLFWIDDALKKETEEAMKTGKTFPPVVRVDTTFKKNK